MTFAADAARVSAHSSAHSVHPERNLTMNAQRVSAQDGLQSAGHFYGEDLPPGKTRGAVLIVPAMGTPQSYYAPFARWLAAQGYLVATFDYRGTGLSRPSSLRVFRADISEHPRSFRLAPAAWLRRPYVG